MKQKVLDWMELLFRVALGGLFVYSAWGKIGDPGLFAHQVMRYELLPECLVGLFSLTLPMLELLVGLALVFTKWTREAALMIVALLAMFIAALAWAVANGLEIDCGCFGVPSVGGRTELLLAIVRDVVLLAPAVWLMRRRNSWLGVRGFALLAVVLLLIGASHLIAERLKAAPPEAPASPAPRAENLAAKKAAADDKPKRKASRRARPAATDWKTTKGGVVDADVEDDDDLSPEDRKLRDAIDDALEKEDLAAVRALSAKALNSGSAEVRQEMVDALGNFGVKALPELTPFLADADEDVRDSAMNEWSVAVSSIENESEKLGIVELAMHVLSNEDSLETISGEYIGADEKLAVESLLRIIEAGGSEQGIAKAKETYEFVTGEEFVDRATAEKWVEEEYEPPAQK